jgi:hypothetical protein
MDISLAAVDMSPLSMDISLAARDISLAATDISPLSMDITLSGADGAPCRAPHNSLSYNDVRRSEGQPEAGGGEPSDDARD